MGSGGGMIAALRFHSVIGAEDGFSPKLLFAFVQRDTNKFQVAASKFLLARSTKFWSTMCAVAE